MIRFDVPVNPAQETENVGTAKGISYTCLYQLEIYKIVFSLVMTANNFLTVFSISSKL